ncbi:MAG: basic amino acid/polyamine antiporter, family [Pseudonocardiales bacterium]|nr:basic amino acid/polyamine antiporter, family [Pseudonocardiales bacterium]
MARVSSERPRSVPLARRLAVGDAVVIGLASMIGAGVFATFAPAARAAGSALLVSLGIAALVAYCNATASAQLAARYPTSGGTYIYGRERLGDWWGFVAGWGFVVGKTASCAAMALTFAAYAVPGHETAQRLTAAAAVAALSALNYRGVTRTASLSRLLVALTLSALTCVVVAIWTGGGARRANLDGVLSLHHGGVHGLLQAAGLLFFAFAGYARIATMGEEVRAPRRTIPRAILVALAVTLVVYAVVALSVLAATGPDLLARSTEPLTSAVRAAGSGGAAPIVRIGAVVASLGSLLALIAGVGRTGLAMARHGDLPRWLAAVHPRYRVPHRAEIALAIAVIAIVLSADVRNVIGFSSFGVLVYYAIANLAAFTQPRSQRRYPAALNVLGVIGCVTLILALPSRSVLAGLIMFAVGIAGRATISYRRRPLATSRR